MTECAARTVASGHSFFQRLNSTNATGYSGIPPTIRPMMTSMIEISMSVNPVVGEALNVGSAELGDVILADASDPFPG